jgi:hypothetical protein
MPRIPTLCSRKLHIIFERGAREEPLRLHEKIGVVANNAEENLNTYALCKAGELQLKVSFFTIQNASDDVPSLWRCAPHWQCLEFWRAGCHGEGENYRP